MDGAVLRLIHPKRGGGTVSSQIWRSPSPETAERLMTRDPRIDPQPGDELRGRGGQTRRVIHRDGDNLWCQDGSMRYKTTVQRWRAWSTENSEQSGNYTQGLRDPRTDPQPGDTLRHPNDQFPRKVLKRQGDRLMVEMGAHNRGWRRLVTWRKWATGTDVVIVSAAENREIVPRSD